MNFTILYQQEENGGYTVTIPELPGCISYGDTIEEAVIMAKEAAELYLEDYKIRGEQFLKKNVFVGNLAI
ncbi:type II toxin-antitoxin system HicB family antitoxin [Candidatus Gracilibacteria bacterium]|nr:type II toxin-antitoxin system HicB family antitoxin [Candidatus Gracilibacteria bacterium]